MKLFQKKFNIILYILLSYSFLSQACYPQWLQEIDQVILNGDFDGLKYLIEQECIDVNTRLGKRKEPLLLRAIYAEVADETQDLNLTQKKTHGEIISYLIKNPAININLPDINGNLALVYAVKAINVAAVKKIIKNPSSRTTLNEPDRKGKTILDHAEDNYPISSHSLKKKNKKIYEILQKAGARRSHTSDE